MEKKETISNILQKNKKIYWFLPLALLGVFLIICGSSGRERGSGAEETEIYYSVRFYTEELEKRIEELCRQVKGVSEAHVLLTMDASSEYVYAENTSASARDYVIVEREGDGALVQIKEIYPEIRGVAVVCSKGGDSEMQRTITELLSAALGIPSSRIRVAGT